MSSESKIGLSHPTAAGNRSAIAVSVKRVLSSHEKHHTYGDAPLGVSHKPRCDGTKIETISPSRESAGVCGDLEPLRAFIDKKNCYNSRTDRIGHQESREIDAMEPTPIGFEGFRTVDQSAIVGLQIIPSYYHDDIKSIFGGSNVAAALEGGDLASRGQDNTSAVGDHQTSSNDSISQADRKSNLSAKCQNKKVPSDVRRYGKWDVRFRNLQRFHAVHGHFRVPRSWPQDPSLSLWIKRQRVQYRLFQKGKYSNLTEDRIKVLEDLGFVWEVHQKDWEARFQALVQFQSRHGHCNVRRCTDDTGLATWIKYQRQNYRHFREGRKSNMTTKRIAMLEKLGLNLDPRSRRY